MSKLDRGRALNLTAHKHYYQYVNIYKGDLDKVVEDVKLTQAYLSASISQAVIQMTAMVRGSTIQEIRHPSNWWQAIRERWFPKWWLSRYPVGYTCYQIDRHYPPTYPDGIIRVYNSLKDRGYLYHA